MKKYIALTIILVCVLGLVGCSSDKPNRDLTIDELIVIAGKGENISWSDFESYNCSEVGSGIISRVYSIGDEYVLHITGWPPDDIQFIKLSTKVEAGGSLDGYREIDIRTESIDDFLKEANQ